jgi:hypothetical protein
LNGVTLALQQRADELTSHDAHLARMLASTDQFSLHVAVGCIYQI